MTNTRPLVGSLLIAAATLAAPALGHGIVPIDTPVDRLVKNIGAYVKEHPDDPEGYYRLGRVHTLALETKTGFVPAFERGRDAPYPAEGSWAHRDWGEKKKPTATEDELKVHLKEAVENLSKAIQLSPNTARYRLTLACALEAGRELAPKMDLWPLLPDARVLEDERTEWLAKNTRDMFLTASKSDSGLATLVNSFTEPRWWSDSRAVIIRTAYSLKDDPAYAKVVKAVRAADWNEQIEVQFFTAMCYALPSDGRATEKPIWGGMDDWVAYEAGGDFIRLVGARTARPGDSIRLDVANATIKAFDALPHPNAITPIVLSLDAQPASLPSLLSDGAATFDLDGSGRRLQWPWLRPNAGLLVWDPTNAGTITSGRQLFGSATWWVLFEHGYQAMDALDDDRDGRLTSSELTGLSVWFDRNSNGTSDPGEVTPVQKLGIRSLSTCFDTLEHGSLLSTDGLQLEDGRVLPTWDWVTTPIPQKTALTAAEPRP